LSARFFAARKLATIGELDEEDHHPDTPEGDVDA
jgi:hypothetical protein